MLDTNHQQIKGLVSRFNSLSKNSSSMSEYIKATKDSIHTLENEFVDIMGTAELIDNESEKQVSKSNQVESISHELNDLSVTNVNHLNKLNILMKELGLQSKSLEKIVHQFRKKDQVELF